MENAWEIDEGTASVQVLKENSGRNSKSKGMIILYTNSFPGTFRFTR